MPDDHIEELNPGAPTAPRPAAAVILLRRGGRHTSAGLQVLMGKRTAAAAIEKAGKAEPAAIKAALWDIKIKGLNGDIVFKKSGPEGKESGQSQPNVYLIEITDGKIGMKTL